MFPFNLIHIIIIYLYRLYLLLWGSSSSKCKPVSPAVLSESAKHTLKQTQLNHLAIVLCEQDVNCDEICSRTVDDLIDLSTRLAHWVLRKLQSDDCVTHVQQLTLYDTRGVLQQHAPTLLQHLKDLNGELSLEIDEQKTCVQNGHLVFNNGQSLRLLSYESCGRPLVTQLAHQIIEQAPVTLRRTNESFMMVREYVEQELKMKKSQALTDPDLLLVFSPVCNLHGFSPIHLRYTQIIHLDESVKHFTYDKLVSCLLRYANCEQRYGA